MDDVSINRSDLVMRLLTEFVTDGKSESRDIAGEDIAQLSSKLLSELCVVIPLEESQHSINLESLARVVESKLEYDSNGNSIVDVFGRIEVIARIEIHRSLRLRWFARWTDFESLGNWLTSPDWLDYVEFFQRIKDEFGVDLGVTTESFATMPETVGETVKKIWCTCKDFHRTTFN